MGETVLAQQFDRGYELMPDYVPLELAEFYNAGVDRLGTASGAGPSALPIGAQRFRGLPFRVGSDPKRCLVAFGPGGFEGGIAIPINQPVRTIVVAHRLLASEIMAGGTVGVPVADYVFHFSDGTEIRESIRDRFEIAAIPLAWGQRPFRSFPDEDNHLPPRYAGSFGDAGVRQTEAYGSSARAYLLWAWVNPRPQELVRALSIVPKGLPFVIAGVTLGQVDENPFVWQGARPI